MATNRLAVLGHPIAHSRSPAMQNAALRELGLAPGWTYEALDVVPERLDERVRAMGGEGFVGANVTVPHKLAALALADDASETAREIDAANTLTFEGGRILAENTDAEGLLAALEESPAGKRALVMGAGGAARAVVWALAVEGADVSVWNRTGERAVELADAFGVSVAGQVDAATFELIVNATRVGLDPDGALDALPLDGAAIHARQTVVDLVYGPIETDLVRLARGRGARVVDGLEVLVRQGAASLRLWTGHEPPIEVMREAARRGGLAGPPVNERT